MLSWDQGKDRDGVNDDMVLLLNRSPVGSFYIAFECMLKCHILSPLTLHQ